MQAKKQAPNRLINPPKPSALEGLSKRSRKAAPVDYPDSLPAKYNRQLQALITAINEDIKTQLLPAVKKLKPQYIADSDRAVWRDGWSSVMGALIAAFSEKWADIGKWQSHRLAQGTITMIEAENSEQFVKSVNRAVGVEVFKGNSELMTEQLEAAALANAQLIKNLTDTHVDKVSTIIMENMRAGYAPSKIAKDLQNQSRMTRGRAKLIARDQTAKLNGELTKLRNEAAGIEYFRWNHSKDGRVGDDHRRAAERDVGFGRGVYRWDAPPKEGIPGRATRPNCRCTASSVFEWEL